MRKQHQRGEVTSERAHSKLIAELRIEQQFLHWVPCPGCSPPKNHEAELPLSSSHPTGPFPTPPPPFCYSFGAGCGFRTSLQTMPQGLESGHVERALNVALPMASSEGRPSSVTVEAPLILTRWSTRPGRGRISSFGCFGGSTPILTVSLGRQSTCFKLFSAALGERSCRSRGRSEFGGEGRRRTFSPKT